MKFTRQLTIAFIFVVLLALAVPAARIRVMTYNIRLDIASDKDNDWNHRRDFLTGQIRFHAADIVGVQEALPNQIKDISDAFPEFGLIGIGRDGEGKGEASAIFYNKTRFQVSQTATFWLSETPDRVSKGWDASYIRICTYGLFKDRSTNRSFWVFNTHLDNNGAVAREKGLDLILKRIDQVNKRNLPVFLTGDFNAEPNSPELKLVSLRMSDARAVSLEKPFGPAATFTGFRYDEPPRLLIDYIFVSDPKRIVVRKYGVLSDSVNRQFPSDHFPVLIEAELKR